MADEKKTILDTFRESLKDAIVIVKELANHCESFSDAVSIMELASENDGQLRMLVSLMNPKQQGRK